MTPKIRIGYFERACRNRLYFPHDSHLLLCAPAGAGKGRDILIPALLEYKKGSVLSIDPKGQLAAVTGRARMKMGQKVYALNPFNILPQNLCMPHVGYNPMSILNPRLDSFGADCDATCNAMVVHEGGGEPHWTNSGQAAVSGLIMSLVALRPEKERNLVRLYQILTGPDFFPFVRWAMKSGHPLIANRLGRFAARKAEDNPELRSIISTAITQLNFLGNTAIARSLNPSGPSLRFSSLRETPSTVFLILPTKYLSACAKWFRLVVQSAMWEMLREGSEGRVQCLALLDEFAQLGVMQILSDMMGIGRGYGIQLWPVLQDLNQLVELYPKRWETFLGNAGAQLFFAPRDNFSAQWISDKCGKTEIAVPRLHHSPVEMWEQEGRQETPMGLGVQVDQIPRPLMLPHEVAYMGGDQLLVFGENLGGIILGGRKSYLKTPEYAGLYDPDPYHAGATNSWWRW